MPALRTTLSTVAMAALASMVATACGGAPTDEPTEGDLEFERIQEALWMQDSGVMWMAERGKLRTEIPVCWNGPPSGDDTQARRDLVREGVAEQWSLYPHIDFTGWGECTSSSPGVHVTVENVRAGTFEDKMGAELDGLETGLTLNHSIKAYDGFNPVVAGCDNYKEVGTGWLPSVPPANRNGKDECIRGIARHEFGHVLGFWHEYLAFTGEVTGPGCTGGPQGTLSSIYPIPLYDQTSIMQSGYCGAQYTHLISVYDWLGAARIYGGGVGTPFPAVVDYAFEYALRAFNGRFMGTNPTVPTANSEQIFGGRNRFRLQSTTGKVGPVEMNDEVYLLGYHICDTTAGSFICGEGYITRSGNSVIVTESPSNDSVWEILAYGETPTTGPLPINAPIRFRNGGYYLKSYGGGDDIVAYPWSFSTADWRIVGPFIQLDSQ